MSRRESAGGPIFSSPEYSGLTRNLIKLAIIFGPVLVGVGILAFGEFGQDTIRNAALVFIVALLWIWVNSLPPNLESD